ACHFQRFERRAQQLHSLVGGRLPELHDLLVERTRSGRASLPDRVQQEHERQHHRDQQHHDQAQRERPGPAGGTLADAQDAVGGLAAGDPNPTRNPPDHPPRQRAGRARRARRRGARRHGSTVTRGSARARQSVREAYVTEREGFTMSSFKLKGFGLAMAAAGGFVLLPSIARADNEGRFESMDTNHDGKISMDEHAAAASKMFDRMDANKDGRVTASEMEAAHKAITG